VQRLACPFAVTVGSEPVAILLERIIPAVLTLTHLHLFVSLLIDLFT
jgi:hypothetical protein